MTSKERLTRLFAGQEVDRVPSGCYSPIIGWDAILMYTTNPAISPCCRMLKNTDTFDRRNYGRGIFCYNSNPEIVQHTYVEIMNGEPTEVREVRYNDLRLRHFVETTSTGKHIRHYVDDPMLLERIADIPYIPSQPDFSPYGLEREELGDHGLMMMDLGDPLCPLYNLCSAADFAIWSLTDYEAMLAFTDRMYERVIALYKTYLENNIGDVFFLVGAEFAGPPLVSPNKFNALAVRYIKGIVDLIRSYGKHSILHYHGNLFRVLDGMGEINPDGLHTIEAPPIGDCTLAQARERLGNMILIGNIQYDDIQRCEQGEIKAMVKMAIEEAQGGRFILSPTAGPYEDCIPQHMVDNYIAFIEAGHLYGARAGKKGTF